MCLCASKHFNIYYEVVLLRLCSYQPTAAQTCSCMYFFGARNTFQYHQNSFQISAIKKVTTNVCASLWFWQPCCYHFMPDWFQLHTVTELCGFKLLLEPDIAREPEGEHLVKKPWPGGTWSGTRQAPRFWNHHSLGYNCWNEVLWATRWVKKEGRSPT